MTTFRDQCAVDDSRDHAGGLGPTSAPSPAPKGSRSFDESRVKRSTVVSAMGRPAMPVQGHRIKQVSRNSSLPLGVRQATSAVVDPAIPGCVLVLCESSKTASVRLNRIP
jgi:hypothetical protein